MKSIANYITDFIRNGKGMNILLNNVSSTHKQKEKVDRNFVMQTKGFLLWLFFPLFLLLSGIPSFGLENSQIIEYNKLFEEKKFTEGLSLLSTFLATDPNSLELHREKAKLLAATEDLPGFLEELKTIRVLSPKDGVKTIVEILNHFLVSENFKLEARRAFFIAGDRDVLLNWPWGENSKVVDCKHIVIQAAKQPISGNSNPVTYSQAKESPSSPLRSLSWIEVENMPKGQVRSLEKSLLRGLWRERVDTLKVFLQEFRSAVENDMDASLKDKMSVADFDLFITHCEMSFDAFLRNDNKDFRNSIEKADSDKKAIQPILIEKGLSNLAKVIEDTLLFIQKLG